MTVDLDRPGVRAGKAELLVQRLHASRARVGMTGALAVLLGSLCIQPLLDGDWWLPRTIAVVAVVVLVGHGARMLHVPAPVQPLVQFAAVVGSVALMFARDEALFGILPGPASMLRLQELLAQGREYAIATQAPAGPDEGLLLMIVAGVGLVALTVDTLAAGLDLPGMTLIPLVALFLLPWAIGRGSAPGWTFVVVAVGWLAVVAALQSDRVSQWSPGARASTPGIGVVIAAATTFLALVAGGLTTPRGPAEPVDLGNGSGGRTVELDSLVSLRRSLVSNDPRPVITLATTATRPDYLRLAILELFDGEQWQPVGPNATGPQPPPGPDGSVPSVDQPPGVPVVEYQLDVGPLGGTTLPSPSGSYLSLVDWPVAWDQRTSLPQRTDGNTVEGARIGLVATAQDLDPDGLRQASTVPPRPEQVFGENLADPTPLTGPELPRLARDITAGSATPFDAAIALQRWFRTDGGFTYSTQIEGGSDEDALATFLEERVGYCEQFAATMALMARSVGIPARVVVGFTQGSREDDQWVVRGTDAHAWPELWMGSAGWVRFEPTPGAPTTTTPSYTRVTAAEPTSSPSASASISGPSTRPTRLPDEEPTGASATDTGQGLPVLAIMVAVTGLLLLLPAAVRLVRRRRRLRSGDGEAAYREVVDTMVDLRLGSEAATPRSTLAGVHVMAAAGGGTESAPVEEAVARILRAVEWQRYGSPAADPRPPDPDLTSAASPTGEQGPRVLIAERQRADPRPGALAGDMRVIRRALARRAGWVRRVVAVLAPLSVITGLAARGPARGDSGVD
jgi:transglutaminase-like putative cysteine protease